jgi:hypothetical protein
LPRSDARYATLQSRLFRIANAMQVITRQRRALERSRSKPRPAPALKPDEPPMIDTDHVAEAELPAFLDRRDAVIAADMTAKRKAAEAEARKQMPLTGRAAMAAVKAKPKRK